MTAERTLIDAGKALIGIVGGIVAVAGFLAFFRMPGDLQISASILAAGMMIAFAIATKREAVVKVYGNDWRASERTEADRG